MILPRDYFAQIYFITSIAYIQTIRLSNDCYLWRFQIADGECKTASTDDFRVYGILHYQGAPEEIPTSSYDDELPIPDVVFNTCTDNEIKNYVQGVTDLNYIGKILGVRFGV